MATHKLKNYLRTYRKRTGFSQKEIAYLLTCDSGAKISRYEHFKREPSLRTALAYESIFNIPVRELFAGTFADVEESTLRRMSKLAARLSGLKNATPRDRKRRSLVEAVLQRHLSHKHKDHE